MPLLPILRQSLPLVALLLGATLVLLSLQPAEAQRRTATPNASQLDYTYVVPKRGGYSLRMRDIWGPAKMPPAPQDFGPHFDYPPESLNSGPTQAPYPN
ncbi:MAG: hypothetical protein ACRECF_01705 [Methyloceanibacter sp.]